MNILTVPFLPITNNKFDSLDACWDKLSTQHMEYLLWTSDGYMPDVSFKVAHNGQNIFLKYTVLEDHITATHKNINDPVFKDTCVEFFISIGNDVNYYNLEFNRLGVCAIGYGHTKYDREDVSPAAIARIKSRKKKLNVEYSDFLRGWELELIIPTSVFVNHPYIDLNNLSAKANFYKCGDDLPQPHFLAWNNIISDEPNFHLPEFFGKLHFLPQA